MFQETLKILSMHHESLISAVRQQLIKCVFSLLSATCYRLRKDSAPSIIELSHYCKYFEAVAGGKAGNLL